MFGVTHAQDNDGGCRSVGGKVVSVVSRSPPIPGTDETAIGITGNQGAIDPGGLEELPGVAEVIRVTKPYKLVSRDIKEENTVITFAGTEARIGGLDLAIIAVPFAI